MIFLLRHAQKLKLLWFLDKKVTYILRFFRYLFLSFHVPEGWKRYSFQTVSSKRLLYYYNAGTTYNLYPPPPGSELSYVVVLIAGYFLHLGMLNQLITLSHQLNSDAFNLTNHKYMAHQTALLYVS